jgi:hypothetical protein
VSWKVFRIVELRHVLKVGPINFKISISLINILVFWVVAPCSVLAICCLSTLKRRQNIPRIYYHMLNNATLSHKQENHNLKHWRVFLALQILYCLKGVNIRDRLCGLMAGVPGYISRDLGFNSRRYKIFWEVVGLKWGPLSLVRTTEKLLEWKSSGSGSRISRLTALGIRCSENATPSIHKICRHAAIARSVYFACGLKPRNFSFLSVNIQFCS